MRERQAGEHAEHDGGEQSPRARVVEQQEDRGDGGRADDGAGGDPQANPPTTSTGRNGVAVMARNWLVHLNPASSGHIASVADVIIAVVAISAGARKAR